MARLRDSVDICRVIEDESSVVRQELRKTAEKRAIAGLLVRLRKHANLTQAELADRACWDKSFVSELEGAYGDMPDTRTIAGYATACGVTVRLVADGIGEVMLGEVVPPCWTAWRLK